MQNNPINQCRIKTSPKLSLVGPLSSSKKKNVAPYQGRQGALKSFDWPNGRVLAPRGPLTKTPGAPRGPHDKTLHVFIFGQKNWGLGWKIWKISPQIDFRFQTTTSKLVLLTATYLVGVGVLGLWFKKKFRKFLALRAIVRCNTKDAMICQWNI